MSYNRCKDTHKFGNKYLPSAYKTQVDFRSHFSGKKVRLIVREIRYFIHDILCTYIVHPLSEDSGVVEEQYNLIVHFRFSLSLLIT